jgi:energy-converting hydrogenase Eha subunit E
MTFEQFFRQYYDSQIFGSNTANQNADQDFWNKVLISSAQETGHSVTAIAPDLFQCEMAAIRIELFGLAWTHYLHSQLEKRYLYEELHYFSDEMKQLTLWEINFTKTYLQENNHSDVWDCMGVYNRTFELAPSTSPYSDATDNDLLKEWGNRVDFECASRLVNRLRIKDYFEKDILSKPLAATLAERLDLNINEDSQAFETLEGFVLLLYYDAKEQLESVTLLTQTQQKFNQPIALQISRVLWALTGLSGFVVVPISFISNLVIAAVNLLTFGLLSSIFNLIWVPIFLGPLLGLSWLWEVLPALRLPIAFIGVPLAFLAYTYIAIVGSLMPWGKYGSKGADLALCDSWPFSRDFLAFMMGMVPRHSERFTNLAPLLSRVRHRNPILESYLDDAELNPRPPSWFLNYLTLDIPGVVGTSLVFYFLWKIHWILAVIAVIPVSVLIKYLTARFVLKVP